MKNLDEVHTFLRLEFVRHIEMKFMTISQKKYVVIYCNNWIVAVNTFSEFQDKPETQHYLRGTLALSYSFEKHVRILKYIRC